MGAKPTWQMFNYAGDDYQRSSDYANGFGLDCAHGTRVVSLINAQVLTDSKSTFSGMAPGSAVMVMRGLKESSARLMENQQPTALAIRAAQESLAGAFTAETLPMVRMGTARPGMPIIQRPVITTFA